jgi:hypothetical protein
LRAVRAIPNFNADRATLAAITDGLAAFRRGAGADMGIHLDTNFNFKTEGYIKSRAPTSPTTCHGWRSTATTRKACA